MHALGWPAAPHLRAAARRPRVGANVPLPIPGFPPRRFSDSSPVPTPTPPPTPLLQHHRPRGAGFRPSAQRAAHTALTGTMQTQMLQRPGARCLAQQQRQHPHTTQQQQVQMRRQGGQASQQPRRQQLLQTRRQAVIAVGAPTAEPPAWLPPIFTPQRVALFVEPSPFSHISGMKNRFESLIKTLREAGDDVMVVTPDPAPPAEFCGAQVVNVLGFKLPFYKSATLLLSLGLSLRVLYYLFKQKPQVIHVSTPGVMCFAAVLYARLLSVPLVMSYHTHIPEYIPRYTWAGLVAPMWSIIRWCTRRADLTLVTSKAMKDELTKNKCRPRSIDVWQRGVDTDVFNPRHKSAAMRARLSDGHPEAPLLVYVGRLGAEKNTEALRDILVQAPGARLALVGDGPQRQQLERELEGLPVKFMGMMKGQELSEAYASADVFVMPSETETLGFVVLEAMASGVPVVAVAAGGLTDIVQHQQTGLLYQPGDYAQAAALVRGLVADAQARARLAAAGRTEVELFGWSAATRVLREKQYARAVRLSIGKRRFWLLALRIRLTCLLRWLGSLIAGLWGRLDYARAYR